MKINLEAAIMIASSNYFALQSIKNKNKALKQLITERWRNYLPSVGLSYIRQRYIIQDSTDAISHEIRLNIEQVIYDGGRRSLSLDIAKLDEALSRRDFVVIYNKLRLDVQEAFFATLAASSKIVLHKKSLQRGLYQLKQAKLELAHGFSTSIQVMSVAARVEEIRLALLQARREYFQSINNLKLIMNVDYETELFIEGDLLKDYYLYFPKIDLRKLVTRAKSERAEVLRSKVSIFKLKKEKQLAENAWIPQFSVGAYGGRFGTEFPLREDVWGFNFKVTVPLGRSTNTTNFNSGVRPNSLAATGIRNDNRNFNNSTNSTTQFYDNMGYDRRVLESKIKLGEALWDRRQLVQKIAIEVNNAADQTKIAWDMIHTGNGNVYFRYHSLKLMSNKLDVGDAKRADILFAETELVKAQDSLVNAFSNYIVSAYRLEWVSGLRPGQLHLFKYKPGEGNTLLGEILDDSFERIRSLDFKLDKDRYIIEKYKDAPNEKGMIIDTIDIYKKGGKNEKK
ncbi:MAG: TolC family protein [Spirochaetota bacterium]